MKTTLKKNKSNVFEFLIAIMVAIIPHIYYFHEHVFSAADGYYNSMPIRADLYMYGKFIALLVFTVIISLCYSYNVLVKNWKFKFGVVEIGLIIVWLLALLSTIYSDYQSVATWGIYQRYEGLVSFTCYLLLIVLIKNANLSHLFERRISLGLLLSSAVMSIIVLLESFGIYVYTDTFLKWIIFPQEYAANIHNYIAKSEMISASMFNPNYLASFIAIGMVATILMYLSSPIRKSRLLLMLVYVLQIYALYQAKSDGALIALGVVLSLIFLFAELKEKIIKESIIIHILLLVYSYFLSQVVLYSSKLFLAIVFVCLIILVAKLLLRKTEFSLSTYRSFFVKYSWVLVIAVYVALMIGGIYIIPTTESEPVFDELKINKAEFLVTYHNDQVIALSVENGMLKANYQNEVFNSQSYDDGNYTLSVGQRNIDYSISKVQVNEIEARTYFLKNEAINLLYLDNEFYMIDLTNKLISDLSIPKIQLLTDNSKQYSSRFYIWGYAIPLVQDTLFIGKGLDTFIYNFPQHELVDRSIAYHSKTIVDKAHNVVLQYALSIGVLGALILVIIIFYALSSIRSEDVSILWFTVLLLAINGFTNDSIIPISLIFMVSVAFLLNKSNTIIYKKGKGNSDTKKRKK